MLLSNIMKTEKGTGGSHGKISNLIVSIGVAVALVVGVMLIHLLVTFILMLFGNDGTNNYTGAKRELAEKAVSDIRSLTDDKLRWAHFYHVEEVRPTTAEEIGKFCKPGKSETSSNSSDPRYYTVVVKTGELFGFQSETLTVDGCNAFGPSKDSPYFKR